MPKPARWIALVFNVIRDMPELRWGLEFGECIQALRSSLDHALVEIAAIKEGTWPNPPTKEDVIQFPICDDPSDFKKALWHLGDLRNDAAVVRRIEGMQPYSRPASPNRPLLTLLRELNNRDKHRVITIARGHVVDMTFNIHNGTGQRLYTFPQMHAGPVEDKTALIVFHFDRPQPDVQMNEPPKFTFYPALPYQVSWDAQAKGHTELVELTALLRAFVRSHGQLPGAPVRGLSAQPSSGLDVNSRRPSFLARVSCRFITDSARSRVIGKPLEMSAVSSPASHRLSNSSGSMTGTGLTSKQSLQETPGPAPCAVLAGDYQQKTLLQRGAGRWRLQSAPCARGPLARSPPRCGAPVRRTLSPPRIL